MSKAKADKQQKRPAGKSRKGVGGRPSKYDPKVTPDQARKLCAAGFTDAQLADFFGVTTTTIDNWKNRHPEFLGALREGKDEFDTERVEKALAHRAVGYSHDEDDIRVVNGEIVITPTTKHYPPDTTAAIFWLKNRNRQRWRDKVDVDHGLQEDNPIMSLLEGIAGRTLKPTSQETEES